MKEWTRENKSWDICKCFPNNNKKELGLKEWIRDNKASVLTNLGLIQNKGFLGLKNQFRDNIDQENLGNNEGLGACGAR